MTRIARPIRGLVSDNVTIVPHAEKANKILHGLYGLRASWRLLIFVATVFTILALSVILIRLTFQGHTQLLQRPVVLTPETIGIGEFTVFIILCIATAIISRIEHRTFAEYGLPWWGAFRGAFWEGSLWGFFAVSGLIGTMFVVHGLRIVGPANHGPTAIIDAMEWVAAFLALALAQEFALRGYPQFTLTMGVGFWPSALILSIIFGLIHAGNSGETLFGLVSVAVFGLFACLALRRTGDLWWPIGFHLGWDWTQTYFFGVPDSGLHATHNLFYCEFRGPHWLTGGTAGLEPSALTLVALLIVAALLARRYQKTRYPEAQGPMRSESQWRGANANSSPVHFTE